MTPTDTQDVSIHLSRAFFEIAKAAAGPIPFSRPDDPDDESFNALVGWTSIPVIYSYLAVESFTNYRLYEIWSRRHDGSEIANRFISELGDKDSFAAYGGVRSFRELHKRVRLLCRIRGFRNPEEVLGSTWQQFHALVRRARKYLVHPYPDPEMFQQVMETILADESLGTYSEVTGAVIGFLYEEAGLERPSWLADEHLIQIKGVEIQPESA